LKIKVEVVRGWLTTQVSFDDLVCWVGLVGGLVNEAHPPAWLGGGCILIIPGVWSKAAALAAAAEAISWDSDVSDMLHVSAASLGLLRAGPTSVGPGVRLLRGASAVRCTHPFDGTLIAYYY
jgi:hypothetical protein